MWTRGLSVLRVLPSVIHSSRLHIAKTAFDSVKKRSHVFRSVLNVKPNRKIDLERTASDYRADVLILDSFDSNLTSYLEQSNNTPLYIRTQKPEELTEVLKTYNHRIEGLVADVQGLKAIVEFSEKLTQIEKEAGLPEQNFYMISIFDSRYPYKDWASVAASSSRLVASILEDNAPENNQILPRPPSRIEVQAEAVLAARASQLHVILGPDMNVSHYPHFRRQCERAKDNGFDGQIALNKDQSIICNDTFSVSFQDKEFMSAVDSARKSGIGVWRRSDQESRQMFGPPHRARAKDLYQKLENETAVHRPTESGIPARMHPPAKDTIEVGAEIRNVLTFDLEAVRSVWERSFPEEAPLQLSHEAARRIGLEERPLPFSMLMTFTMCPSLIAYTGVIARYHLSSNNAIQYRPIRASDVTRTSYFVNSIRHSKAGYPIVETRNVLYNERNDVLFSVDKRTMLNSDQGHLVEGRVPTETLESNPLLDHIMRQDYSSLRPNEQQHLHTGQIICHEKYKQFYEGEVRNLCNLIRAPHGHHLNIRRYHEEDLVVFGLGMHGAIAHSSSPDLGHVLYETLTTSMNVNPVNQTDRLRSVTYVRNVRDLPGNEDLQELEIKTFAFRNVDPVVLTSTRIPELLLNDDSLRPAHIEKELGQNCTELQYLMAGFIVRNVIRIKSPSQ